MLASHTRLQAHPIALGEVAMETVFSSPLQGWSVWWFNTIAFLLFLSVNNNFVQYT